jgi:hypothetical protein
MMLFQNLVELIGLFDPAFTRIESPSSHTSYGATMNQAKWRKSLVCLEIKHRVNQTIRSRVPSYVLVSLAEIHLERHAWFARFAHLNLS